MKDKNNNNITQEVDFGYQGVDPSQKPGLVKDLFDRVSTNYDLMNDVMSAGIHRIWKNRMIECLQPYPGMTLLDVAGGTGDISSKFLKRIGGAKKGRAIICDLSEGMILKGRNRAIDSAIFSGIDWVVGDAENLPLSNRSVDAYTIAFGVRNVTNKDKALEEAVRVLKPGGRFVCLEFSSSTSPIIERLYSAYSFLVIPTIGEIVAKDREAYRYLVESIREFPSPPKFTRMIEVAGFGGVNCMPMSGGIASLYSGWRI